MTVRMLEEIGAPRIEGSRIAICDVFAEMEWTSLPAKIAEF